MDMFTFLETIKANPACYFIAGIVLGYVLRVYISEFRGKRPSRYQSRKVDSSAKRASIVADLNEPSFDWTDSAVKAITPRRLGSIPLDQHGNEFQ